MTVKELIENLQNLPPDGEVTVIDEFGIHYSVDEISHNNKKVSHDDLIRRKDAVKTIERVTETLVGHVLQVQYFRDVIVQEINKIPALKVNEDDGTEEVCVGDVFKAYYEMKNAPTVIEAEE